MTDDSHAGALKNALEKVLDLEKGVPFGVVIRALANHSVIPIDLTSEEDRVLVARVTKAIRDCAAKLIKRPIERPRPNEVGNDVVPFVMESLRAVGYHAERPRSKAGRGKATGYPDILFFDDRARPSYLECKIFSDDTKDTTMRSFYLSPSDDFKISMDARHLLVSFEMLRFPINGSNNSRFTPVSFKIADLYHLRCDLKLEFNSDNRRLYDDALVLASERC